MKEIINMGHPTLRKVAQVVKKEEILSKKMPLLIQEMIETLEDEEGLGLAAPQINVSKQIALVKILPDEESDQNEILVTLFNPQITVLDETKQGFWEGCLSVPGLRGFVERPSKIKVDYLDQNAKNKTLFAEGFQATIFQHELDHLRGVIYIDHIKDTKLLAYQEEFEEFIEPTFEE